jgi:hypothetical protein
MPWEPEHNRRSLSPFGLKEATGHAAPGVHDIHSVGCPPMPEGITGAPLNPDPHGGGDKASPYASPSSHRPRGKPQQMRPPHMAQPHRYGADPGPRESDIITPRSKP